MVEVAVVRECDIRQQWEEALSLEKIPQETLEEANDEFISHWKSLKIVLMPSL